MDVAIGEREVWTSRMPFGLTVADRRYHVFSLGTTGSGKSTLMRNMIVQDIQAGRGCMVIDPHGTLAEELLDYVPPWRSDDLLYFDPADLSHSPGLNPLEHVAPDERALMAAEVVSIFKHLWRDSWGARLEYILLNSVAALLDYPPSRGGVSLLGVPRLFTDEGYRAWVVREIRDPRTRAFWTQEFPGYPPSFRAEALSSVQNKIGALLATPAVRHVLGQSTSTIRIADIMDGRKIFIANLSKGRLGESAANLLGSLLLTSVQMAAMRRASILEESRVDFACYLDEFQNFTTDSFALILSEVRKYRLGLVLTTQLLANIPQTIQAAIFGNVGTLVSFRVGVDDAEVLAKALSPYSAEQLQELGRGEVCARLTVNGSMGQPFFGTTLPTMGATHDNRPNLIAQSRRRYARPRAHVESRIDRWMRREFPVPRERTKRRKGDMARRPRYTGKNEGGSEAEAKIYPRAGQELRITPRDVDIIRQVARHRFIRSTQIIDLIRCQFPGSSRQGILRRLDPLFHRGYLSRPRSQRERCGVGGGAKPMVYCLGNHGIDLLAKRFGYRRSAIDWTAKARETTHSEIEHALEVTDFMVALELACHRRGNARVCYLDDILAAHAPAVTRNNPRPYLWPVPVRWQGRATTIHISPDRIFEIELLDMPERSRHKFFFHENDTGTMPVVASRLTRSSYVRKLIAYGHSFRAGLHTKVYGFSNVRVLTVTRGRSRIENIQAAYLKHASKLCPPAVFLFADRSSLLSADDFLSHAWIDGAGNARELLE